MTGKPSPRRAKNAGAKRAGPKKGTGPDTPEDERLLTALREMEASPVIAEVRKQVAAAQADAPVHPGFVHAVQPLQMYGDPGVAVRVSWLEDDGQVIGKIIWVHMMLVPELLAAADSLHSEEFKAGMAAIGA